MQARLQVSIILGAFAAAFFLGFNISSESGIEPGYFETAEAGAYGVVATSDQAPAKYRDLVAEYYKSLLQD